MKKIKITEFTSADAVKALIGAFIFNKVSGKEAQARKIKQSVSSHDKAIEKQLDAIDKAVEKNAKAAKAALDKLPDKEEDQIIALAKQLGTL